MDTYWTWIREHVLTKSAAHVTNLVVNLLQSVDEEYQTLAKLWQDSMDLWMSARMWADDETIPMACLAEPKEQLVASEWIERFVAPPLDPNAGLQASTYSLSPGLRWIGQRNPEKPGGYVMAVGREGMVVEDQQAALMQWTSSRQALGWFNMRIFHASEEITSLNAELTAFLKVYRPDAPLSLPVGLAMLVIQRVRAHVYMQRDLKMVRISRMPIESSQEQTMVKGVAEALTWKCLT